MGDNGGYSPSATASSCENGGRDVDVDTPSLDLEEFGGWGGKLVMRHVPEIAYTDHFENRIDSRLGSNPRAWRMN